MSQLFISNNYSGSVHCAATGSSVPPVANVAHDWQHFLAPAQRFRLFQDTQDKEGGSIFEDSLIESSSNLLKRNPWAAVASFAFQLLIVVLLIVAPLFYTEPLPGRQVVTILVAPPPPPPATYSTKLRTPPEIPKAISISPSPKAITFPKSHNTPKTNEGSPDPAVAVSAMAGGVPGGVVGGVPGGVLGGTGGAPLLAKMTEPAPMPAKKVRVPSRVAEGYLLHDVAPEYPSEAGRARIEGSVVLLAVIGKDGTVQDLQVKSGLPLLAQAAINAVKQWRYRPYMLNGEPVEVDTQITIDFTLSGG